MKISGFQKLTLLDYPSKTACLIFTQGCNFKCPFCQNSELISTSSLSNQIDENEIFQYLEKRKNILDGICISGGEPLIQKDILEFIKKVKEMGFKVKLDTNGSNPIKLKELIDQQLLDYIAMDIKNDFDKYDQTVQKEKLDIENIKKSIDIIQNSLVEFEFRTTIVKEFHEVDDLKKICQYINIKAKYFLQNFQDSENVLQKGLHGFTNEELLEIKKSLINIFPNIQIRGL